MRSCLTAPRTNAPACLKRSPLAHTVRNRTPVPVFGIGLTETLRRGSRFMKTKLYLAMTLSTLLAIGSVSAARECAPQHENHSQHSAQKDEMNSRGDHAM